MSFNLSGSLYNQAMQVHKTIKLGAYNVNPEKTKFIVSYTNSYETGKIDSTPKALEFHKIDFIG